MVKKCSRLDIYWSARSPQVVTHSLTHSLTYSQWWREGEEVQSGREWVCIRGWWRRRKRVVLFSPKSSPESLKYEIIPQLEHRKKGKREELWAQGFSQKVAVTRNSTCNEVQPADYKIFFFDNHLDYFLVFVLAVRKLLCQTQSNLQWIKSLLKDSS